MVKYNIAQVTGWIYSSFNSWIPIAFLIILPIHITSNPCSLHITALYSHSGTFSLSLSPTQSTLNVNQGFRQRSASLCTPSKKSLLGLTKLSGKKTPEHSMSTEDFVHEMPVLSPTQSTLNVNQGFRQRSASLCVSSKKSLLGLTKLSGKKTPKHSIDTGKDINTHAIDNTLATIRNQLVSKQSGQIHTIYAGKVMRKHCHRTKERW